MCHPQRTEQLDKIGEYRRQIVRDKNAVDARIRTLSETHTQNFKVCDMWHHCYPFRFHARTTGHSSTLHVV